MAGLSVCTVSISGLGIKYCERTLDVLEKAVDNEKYCQWPKFGPHIVRISKEVDALRVYCNPSWDKLSDRLQQFKKKVALRSLACFKKRVEQFEKTSFFYTYNGWILPRPESAYSQMRTLIDEMRCFKCDCPDYDLRKMTRRVLEIRDFVTEFWKEYRAHSTIPRLVKIPIYKIEAGSVARMHSEYIHSQIKNLKVQIGQDSQCLPHHYSRLFDLFTDSIHQVEQIYPTASRINGSLSLRLELSQVRFFFLQRNIPIVKTAVQSLHMAPDTTFVQYRQIREKVGILWVEQRIFFKVLQENRMPTYLHQECRKTRQSLCQLIDDMELIRVSIALNQKLNFQGARKSSTTS
jgi:hypothetical protein